MSIIATAEWEAELRHSLDTRELCDEWMVFFHKHIFPELPEDWRVIQIKLLDEGGQKLNVRARSINNFHKVLYRKVVLPDGVRFPVHLLDPKAIGVVSCGR